MQIFDFAIGNDFRTWHVHSSMYLLPESAALSLIAMRERASVCLVSPKSTTRNQIVFVFYCEFDQILKLGIARKTCYRRDCVARGFFRSVRRCCCGNRCVCLCALCFVDDQFPFHFAFCCHFRHRNFRLPGIVCAPVQLNDYRLLCRVHTKQLAQLHCAGNFEPNGGKKRFIVPSINVNIGLAQLSGSKDFIKLHFDSYALSVCARK